MEQPRVWIGKGFPKDKKAKKKAKKKAAKKTKNDFPKPKWKGMPEEAPKTAHSFHAEFDLNNRKGVKNLSDMSRGTLDQI